MKIRIKFAKYGAIKYIGHLDVMRFFQKAIRRAGIDIKYSEGFSPHQIMSFAAPLGVGMESMGEYLDIEVNSMTSTKEMKDALNAVTVDGIDILSVKILPDSCKNAMASVAAASYITRYDTFPIEDIENKLLDFYTQERIAVIKKTKKSEMEVDLKPGIYELKMDKSEIYMLVNASSSGNIKPSMVLDAFCSYCNAKLPTYSCQITRLDIYTSITDGDGKEKLCPLEEIGHD